MKTRIWLSWWVFLLFAGTTVMADDIEIYGTTETTVQPNVLIVFDTSGSMATEDVVSEYYDPDNTYSGNYTSSAVYMEETSGSGRFRRTTYTLFADSVEDLDCASVVESLETDGYSEDAGISDASGGYDCSGSSKDLYMGNWLNYDAGIDANDYRTRIAVAQEVITDLVTETENVRFGLMRFNYSQGGRVVCEIGSSSSAVASAVGALTASGWTPLAETLAEAGLYFAGMDSWFNSGVTYTSPMEYRCQKNYIILMTDGEPTQDIDSKLYKTAYINGDIIGDYDGDGEDPGSYSSYGSDYLDDVAKYLYTNDCNASLGADDVSYETQNIITYTIGFNTDQSLLMDTAQNGGGEYFTVSSVSGLAAAFESILAEITEDSSVFAAPVVPISLLNQAYSGDYIYIGFFAPQTDEAWIGNLKKYGLESDGTIVDVNGDEATQSDGTITDNAQSYWSETTDGSDVDAGGLGALLLDQADRNLYTYMGTQSDLTREENAFSTDNALITYTTLDVSDEDARDDVIEDLYGGSKEWIMGDIIHSSPAVVGYDTDGDEVSDEAYIFFGTNGGVLHCFKESSGSEAWGFVPPDQLTRLSLLTYSPDTHHYFVDGVPVVYEVDDQAILLFGERRGGESYYALDVTDPTQPQYLYAVDEGILCGVDSDNDGSADGDDALLGQSWCTPAVFNILTSDGSAETVMLLTGGYDENQDADTPDAEDSVGRAVFTVNVSDGKACGLNINPANYSELQHCITDATGLDTDGDGYMNRVYAGDLGGDMFAFEDDDGDGTWTARKLFSAGGDGTQRKIFYGPDAVAESGGEMIFFGTGDRADPKETGVINRIYAVRNDWADDATALTEDDLTDVTDNLLQVGTEEEQAFVADALENSRGWYIRLDDNSGEKIISSVLVYAGVLYFTSYTPDEAGDDGEYDPCAAGDLGISRLYALDYENGAAINYTETTDAYGNTIIIPQRASFIGTSIASDPTIAINSTGGSIYIGVSGGVQDEQVEDENLIPFYWRQLH